MNIKKSNLFLRDIKKVKLEKNIIDKTLALFQENPNHPSLHKKQIICKRASNLFSLRITKQYRLLYLKYDEYIELYRVLNHDKYDRLTKDC
jgi:Txe/YoeB family toxin of Txe-Axe toxin-antitoxin module